MSIIWLMTTCLLSAASCLDFAAHQLFLWDSATNGGVMADKSIQSLTAPLPTPYDATYTRGLSIVGLAIQSQYYLSFQCVLQPHSSDSSATVDVTTFETYLYKLSVHVIFTKSSSHWVWLQTYNHTCTMINDTATNVVEVFAVTFTATNIITSNVYLEYAFLTSLKTQSTGTTPNGITLNTGGVSAPNTVHLSAFSQLNNQVRALSFTVLLFNKTYLNSNTIARYITTRRVNQTHPLTAPEDFDIPFYYDVGGYDTRCLMGLTYLWLGGNSSALTLRSVFFDARDAPFSQIENDIPDVIAGVKERFLAQWNVMCFMTCPNGTYYNVGACAVNCAVDNCTSCSTSTVCLTCQAQFYLSADNSSCNNCSNETLTCLTCLNASYCLTCVSSAYTLDNSSMCVLCSQTMGNCLYCNASNFCTACVTDYYALRNDSSDCDLCISSMPLCSRCTSNSYCIDCVDPNVAYMGGCDACSTHIPDCYTCTNTSYCNQCQLGYGYTNNHSQCLPCSSISDCLNCSSTTYCIACDSSFFLAPSGPNQYCLSCSFALSNCVNCSNSTTCIDCISDAYFLNSNGTCSACSLLLPSCLVCSVDLSLSQYNCTSCVVPLFVNGSQQCDNCSLAMANCLLCSNSSVCTQCINTSFAFSAPHLECRQCDLLYPYCLQCDSLRCLVCPQGLQLVNGSLECGCVLGDLVNGICTSITGCTMPAFTPDGTATCLECDSALFHSIPVDGVCVCLQGTLINGLCSTVVGCISPIILSDNSSSCLACNMSLHFVGTPDATGQCLCQTGYQLQGASCQDICGDGLLMQRDQSTACDDGNNIDGDGCSAVCHTEVGYRCTFTSPTTCTYAGVPLLITLDYIERNQALNQGTFCFQIRPPLLNVNKMDLTQHITLQCQDTSYQLTFTDYQTGTLTLTVDYSTDMEDRQCQLDVSFDSAVIISPNATLSFAAVSRTSPLLVSHKMKEYATIKLIFGVLSYIVLGVFLASLPHKMIGAELLLSTQLVYLSNCLYAKPTFLGSSLKQLRLVTGGWSFFYSQDADSDYLRPFSSRIDLAPSFLDASLAVLTVILLFGLLILVLFIVQQAKTVNSSMQSNRAAAKNDCISLAIKVVYSFLWFPTVAAFFLAISVSSYIHALRLPTHQPSFNYTLNALSLLLIWMVLGVVAAVECLPPPKSRPGLVGELKGVKGAKGGYVGLFLARSVLLGVFIQLGASLSFDKVLYLITVLQVGYLLTLIFYRPYNSILDQLGILTCSLSSLYAICLALLQRFIAIVESTQVFLLLILQGVLMLTIAIAIIRTVVEYRSIISNRTARDKSNAQQQEDMKYMEENAMRQVMPRYQPYGLHHQLHHRPIEHNVKVTPVNAVIGTFTEDNDPEKEINRNKIKGDPQLNIIKNRLRDNLLRKRRVNIQEAE